MDPNLDPQYYVDRYNKEITYKNWFDKTYPEMTIYDAVGVEEPEIEEEEFGECGEGTDLVDGHVRNCRTEKRRLSNCNCYIWFRDGTTGAITQRDSG